MHNAKKQHYNMQGTVHTKGSIYMIHVNRQNGTQTTCRCKKNHYNMQGMMHTKGSIYMIHVIDRMVHRLDACTVNGLSHKYKLMPHTRNIAQHYVCLIYTVHTQTTSIHTALYNIKHEHTHNAVIC